MCGYMGLILFLPSPTPLCTPRLVDQSAIGFYERACRHLQHDAQVWCVFEHLIPRLALCNLVYPMQRKRRVDCEAIGRSWFTQVSQTLRLRLNQSYLTPRRQFPTPPGPFKYSHSSLNHPLHISLSLSLSFCRHIHTLFSFTIFISS